MRDFRQLRVWQRAHRLTLACYQSTRGFPKEERFGLASQIRRCASSIGANIAEGCGRDTSKDFRRFLSIAAGSVTELRNHLVLCRDLGILDGGEFTHLDREAETVRRMLAGLLARPGDRE